MFERLMLLVHVPTGVGGKRERYLCNAYSTSLEVHKDLNFLSFESSFILGKTQLFGTLLTCYVADKSFSEHVILKVSLSS